MNRYSIRRIGGKTEYPIWSMALVLMLILISPFVSPYLNYVALLICIYRVIRYDAKVFATDYCLMIPLSQLFRSQDGMSLLIWLCLLAAVWYFVNGGIRRNGAVIALLVLLNYLILRMQMNINDFVLCFGQVFVLYVLLMKQDQGSAERAIKAFCWSVFATSVYALVFRGTPQLIAICGREVPAFFGSNLKRFQGLFVDPNNYMSLVILALALLCKIRDAGRIGTVSFWLLIVTLAIFGAMSYSKTYLIVLVLLGGIYIIWQFWNKKAFRGMVLATMITIVGAVLLLWEGSPLAVIMDRFSTAENLDDLTTGRTELFATYMNVITENAANFLFGVGLNGQMLSKDPHNLYLEIWYLFGAVGLVLFTVFFITLMVSVSRRTKGKQNLIAKYVVLWMVLAVYMSLHGITGLISYASFLLAYFAMMITKKEEAR